MPTLRSTHLAEQLRRMVLRKLRMVLHGPCPDAPASGTLRSVDDMADTGVAPYYTVHSCTRCGADVHGLHGRWTCQTCGECSPYVPPPEGWQADPGYREPPPASGRQRRAHRR